MHRKREKRKKKKRRKKERKKERKTHIQNLGKNNKEPKKENTYRL